MRRNRSRQDPPSQPAPSFCAGAAGRSTEERARSANRGETPGRKAMGAKVLRRYASPAAGYFASENSAKKGSS